MIINTTINALANGNTYTSDWLTVENSNAIVVALKTDRSGILYVDFSIDKGSADSTLTFDIAASVNEVHRITVTRPYCRIRIYNNSGSNQTYLRSSVMAGDYLSLNSALNSSIQSDADAQIVRSVLTGATDSGNYKNVNTTTEGHLEVALHDPRLPFGSIHTENLTPIFQSDAVYGLNPLEVLATTGHSTGGVTSATNTGTNNVFKCSTGTTALSFATIQSRRRLRYRAGQGVVGRFAGFFSAPAAQSIVVGGFGSSESGFYFGYNGTAFGILHSTGGVREIQTLTVTVGAGGSENVTVKLNNIDTVVAVTAGSATNTAYQLSQATYAGWSTVQRGATVVFLANDVGNKASTFSLSSTGTTAGTFAETLAGVAATDTWYPQTEWNGDVCDGSNSESNPSGYDLDPSKGNVYQIGIQYLGFGAVSFQIETISDDKNNPIFTTVHTIKFPNTRTSTTLTQPSFPFTMAAYSAGSTTNVSISVGSFAGMIEGQKRLTGGRFSYVNSKTSSTSDFVPLFTIRNDRVFQTRANQSVVNLLSVNGAAKSTNGITTFYIIRNATLAGTPNFTSYATTSSVYWDTAATTCTFASNDQLIFTTTISEAGDVNFAFADEITLQPGETVTLAVKSVTQTAVCVGGLNTREDN